MKICELCKSRARICCESDEANLCWDCDFRVHSANFLVAKHLRNLLCHVCQSPTPWNASGEKLGRTISVCERCVRNSVGREVSEGGNDEEEEIDSDDDDDDEDEGDSDSDVEEDGDIQVVPSSDSAPPPLPASSSTIEESSSGTGNGGRDICLKRLRENSLDLCSEDDPDCTSSDKNIFPLSAPVTVAAGCARSSSFVDSLPRRPLKSQKTESNRSVRVHQGPSDPRSTAIVQTRFLRNPSDGSYNDPRDVGCDNRRILK